MVARNAEAAPLAELDTSLEGRVVALSESRELDVLENLFRRRGAQVVRCPLLSIVDAPDPAPVAEWLKNFIATPPEFFILITGEGLQRLLDFIGRHGQDQDAFLDALRTTRIVSRGPKPARVLRRLGLAPDLPAPRPTTGGVIELLEALELEGRRVSVQLYGDDPNTTLMNYLQRRRAVVDTIAPYRYADEASEDRVLSLVRSMADNAVDALVFTSQAQVERLFRLAINAGMRETLDRGLDRTCIAAIGPVVRTALAAYGCRTDIEPESRYFMKPLVATMVQYFTRPRSGMRG